MSMAKRFSSGSNSGNSYTELTDYAGIPISYLVQYDHPYYEPGLSQDTHVMPRSEFGVPAHIPPELADEIVHTVHVPPQYYPWLKKLGDDTPALKPFTDKLIEGTMTFEDYEEMYYKFAKPLKVHRKLIPIPYRTPEEQLKSDEVYWEGAWHSFRQRVLGDYHAQIGFRDYLIAMSLGVFYAWLWIDAHRQYRIDMKLYYLEAPEHKINWVKPRGDL